jgi:membrane associated rhomboid family serine protease
MLILPYGHDKSVYGRQWITWFLIAINVVVFLATTLMDRGADERIRAAVDALDSAHEIYPEARVPSAVFAPLQPRLRAVLAFITSDDPDDADAAGSFEVRKAARRLVAAVEDRPSARFGYRPGRPSLTGFLGSPFLHADIWHLAGNMLFLWIVGTVIECYWESLPFAILYAVSAAIGTLAHHLAAPTSLIPLIGASGAIAGVMGAFLVGHPRTRVKMFLFPWFFRPGFATRAVPVWLLLPGWFFLQLGFGIQASAGQGEGVAYWAHVGGFLAGVAGAVIMKLGGWVVYDAAEVLKSERA